MGALDYRGMEKEGKKNLAVNQEHDLIAFNGLEKKHFKRHASYENKINLVATSAQSVE